MIPKTKLIYSYIYGKRFDSGFCDDYICKLQILFKEFKKIYNKYINEILEVISKESNIWEVEYIPIYLTINIIPFSNPLTLRYNNNPKYILTVLIHELIHNNINKKFINREELHKYIKRIMDKVINNLSINLEPEYEELLKNIK